MLTALVTGGAGFIGSHLCEALTQSGYKVLCVDNLSTGVESNLDGIPNIEFIQADVNEPQVWQQINQRRFDVVFHYAATVGVRLTEEQPMQVLKDAYGIQHLVNFASTGHARRIVFASSSEVYGKANKFPSRETNATIAWNPYTAIKLYGEHVMRSLTRAHNVPTLSLRFFNVYGPRQLGSDYGFVMGKFLQQALNRQPFTIYGDGEQTRDFMFVGDNIRLTLGLLKNPAADGKVFNIGTGKETSIRQAAKVMARMVGYDKFYYEQMPARRHDVSRRRASTAKLQKYLGRYPQVTTLNEGAKLTWQWYQAQAPSINVEPSLEVR